MSTSNCTHPTCQGQTCRRPVKPGIKKVSDRRRTELMVYSPIAKKFREENPVCEIKGPGCTGQTQCVHHSKGRIGELLTDVTHFIAACYPCNLWVETDDAAARERGFKISKFKPEENA